MATTRRVVDEIEDDEGEEGEESEESEEGGGSEEDDDDMPQLMDDGMPELEEDDDMPQLMDDDMPGLESDGEEDEEVPVAPPATPPHIVPAPAPPTTTPAVVNANGSQAAHKPTRSAAPPISMAPVPAITRTFTPAKTIEASPSAPPTNGKEEAKAPAITPNGSHAPKAEHAPTPAAGAAGNAASSSQATTQPDGGAKAGMGQAKLPARDGAGGKKAGAAPGAAGAKPEAAAAPAAAAGKKAAVAAQKAGPAAGASSTQKAAGSAAGAKAAPAPAPKAPSSEGGDSIPALTSESGDEDEEDGGSDNPPDLLSDSEESGDDSSLTAKAPLKPRQQPPAAQTRNAGAGSGAGGFKPGFLVQERRAPAPAAAAPVPAAAPTSRPAAAAQSSQAEAAQQAQRKEEKKKEKAAAQKKEEKKETKAAPAVMADEFKLKLAEEREALRRQLGLGQSSKEEPAVARCGLRPGTCGSQLCEHKATNYDVRESQKRLVLSCTAGCSVTYHYPRCWRKFQQDYKQAYPNKEELLKSKQLISCITEGCPGYVKLVLVTEGPQGEGQKQEQYAMPKALEEKVKEAKREAAAGKEAARAAALAKKSGALEEAGAKTKRAQAGPSTDGTPPPPEAPTRQPAAREQPAPEVQWKQPPLPPPAPRPPRVPVLVPDDAMLLPLNSRREGEPGLGLGGSGRPGRGAAGPPPPPPPRREGPGAAARREASLLEVEAAEDLNRRGGAAAAAGRKKKGTKVSLDTFLGVLPGDKPPPTQQQQQQQQAGEWDGSAYEPGYHDGDEFYAPQAAGGGGYRGESSEAVLAAAFNSTRARMAPGTGPGPSGVSVPLRISEFPSLEQAQTASGAVEGQDTAALFALKTTAKTNVLLAECVDLSEMKVHGIEDALVESFFMEKFGAFGTVLLLRVFEKEEAVAVEMSSESEAADACCFLQNSQVYRKQIKLCHLEQFPTDEQLAMTFADYDPLLEYAAGDVAEAPYTQGQGHHLPHHMQQQQGSRVRRQQLPWIPAPPPPQQQQGEGDGATAVQREAALNPGARVFVPPAGSPSMGGARTGNTPGRALSPPPQPQRAAAADPGATPNVLSRASDRLQQQQSDSISESEGSGRSVLKERFITGVTGGAGDRSQGQGEQQAGGSGAQREESEQGASVAGSRSRSSSMSSLPAAAGGGGGAEAAAWQQFDAVHISCCNEMLLRSVYRENEQFKIAAQEGQVLSSFLSEPHRILGPDERRSALVLFNVDNQRMEGIWAAVRNLGEQDGVEFRVLEAFEGLPEQRWTPVLAPHIQLPICRPERVDGAAAAALLKLFYDSRQATTTTPPPTPPGPAAAPPPQPAPAAAAVPPPAAGRPLAPPILSMSAMSASNLAVRPMLLAAGNNAASTSTAAAAPRVPPALQHLPPHMHLMHAAAAAAHRSSAKPPVGALPVQPQQVPVQLPAPPPPGQAAAQQLAASPAPRVAAPLPPAAVRPAPAAAAAAAPPTRPAAAAAATARAAAAAAPSPPAAAPRAPPPARAAAPAAPAAAQPPAPPAPAPAPAPPASAPQPPPTKAPAAQAKVALMMCSVCKARRSVYVNRVCKHLGPCDTCLPDLAEAPTKYPLCLVCSKPHSLFKIIIS